VHNPCKDNVFLANWHLLQIDRSDFVVQEIVYSQEGFKDGKLLDAPNAFWNTDTEGSYFFFQCFSFSALSRFFFFFFYVSSMLSIIFF